MQSTIAEELAALGKDAEEYRKNKILELLSLNFSLISQENEYEEKNIKRLLYVTITYFAEAMHYVEKENSGSSRKGINVLVEDLEKIMKTLKDDYSVKTRGSSGHSGIYSLFSDAKELVIQENGYNSTNFDDYFSSQVQKSMEKEPNNYNLLRWLCFYKVLLSQKATRGRVA